MLPHQDEVRACCRAITSFGSAVMAATTCLAGDAYRVRPGGSCRPDLPSKSDTCQPVGRIVHVKRLAATLMLCRTIVTKL